VKPSISLVCPVFNEHDNLGPLVQTILKVMPGLKREWELILVDDGSTDGSASLMTTLARENAYIKAVHLTRNFGQTAALAAGFDQAKGEVIITLDADLQNDPEDIPLLLKKLEETNADIVSGWRKDRQDPWLRSLFSRTANWLIAQTTNTPLHDIGCTLKAYKKAVFENISLYGEMHRFIPALAMIQGFKVVEIPVKHHPRQAGKSKYGLSRTLKVLLDLLTVKFLASYQTKPIYMFGAAGFFLLFLGGAAGLFVIIRRLFFEGIWLSPMLFIAILLIIIGVQFILMGLIAEIQIRTWFESSGKKPYQIKMIND
jgi:glycosyltransferase involved in cell wall biosynthesis